jgi:PAS domain S-box-containing protein
MTDKEQKQSQKKIDFATLPKFDTFLKSCMSMMAVNRVSDRVFVQVNDAFVNVLGYSRNEILGNTGRSLQLFVDVPEHKKAMQKLSEKGFIKDQELNVKTKTGSILTGLFSGEIITVEGAQYILTIMVDITERRRIEQELQTTFEYAAVGIVNASVEGKYLKVNKCMCEITGYSKEELLEKNFRDITHPDDLATDEDIMLKFLSGKINTFVVEKRYIRKDNSIVWTKLSISGARNKDDNLDYLIVVVQDISQRKNVERELVETNRRFKLAADSAGFGVWDFDIANNKLVWDDKMCQLYGVTRQEFEQHDHPWTSMLHPADSEHAIEQINQAIKNCNDLNIEFRIIQPAGKIVYIESRAVVVRDDDGKALRMTGINYNITERKEAEKALLDSEARFKALHNATFGGIAIHEKGIILDCNQGLAELTGFTIEELVGMDGLLLISEETRDDAIKNIKDGYEKPYEAKGVRKDGSQYPLRLEAKNVPYMDKTVRVVEFRDISEDKESEKEHKRMMAAIEQLAESIMITSPDGKVVYVNPAFTKITGYSFDEVFGRDTSFLESGLHDETFYREIYDVIGNGETWKGRFTNLKKDGTTYISDTIISPVKDSKGNIVNLVAVEEDVTEKIAKEEHLRQSRKLESIGKLAGGVAHDFNNLLMVIMGYVDLSRDELEEDHPAYELLNEVTSAAERSVVITRQLLAFARKQNISPKVIDLNESISVMLKLLSRMIGEDINLQWVPCDSPWMVKIDPGQIDQIMTNLFVNARDAIDGVGNIMIETYCTDIASDYDCGDNAGVTRGQYVVIAFSDDGCGMDEKTQDNAFEPFFTTKDIGKGTGLGLATIYGIVRQNNGYANVYSEPGQGTTFRIYLPRFVNVENNSVESDEHDSVVGGNETILLTEDEKNIRIITGLILERLGYNLLMAADPEEAIKLASEHSGKIDLLLSDVIMPIMNGLDLAKELKKTRPEMKKLFMSGYTANVVAMKDIVDEKINFLSKPFSREILSHKIREILDA